MVISWDLPRRSHLQVEVFDLAGRRIADLVGEVRRAGPGSVAWNGRDTRGRSMASGVYAVRLAAEGTVETRQVTLVR